VLRSIERLPKLEDVMSLGFVSMPAREAYAEAGSFVRFLFDTRGASAVRAVYHAGTLDALDEPVGTLEREWHAFLDREPVDAPHREIGRARFQRGSIFERPCPHVIAALRSDLGRDAIAGNLQRAIATCRTILAIDPGDVAIRVSLIEALAHSGNLDDAEALRESLVRAGAAEPFLARADEALGDELWRRGHSQDALVRYENALGRAIGDDERRVLDVKKLAIESGGRGAAVIRQLLAPPPGRYGTPTLGVHAGHELAEIRDDGLGSYLVGRNLLADGRYEEARAPLRDALALGLPTESLRAECLRLAVRACVASRGFEEARTHIGALEAIPEGSFQAQEWRVRVEFLERRAQRD
jgi:tetratricopeptide (TPR) repeat protein